MCTLQFISKKLLNPIKLKKTDSASKSNQNFFFWIGQHYCKVKIYTVLGEGWLGWSQKFFVWAISVILPHLVALDEMETVGTQQQ